MEKKVKVLVVDDSLLTRKILSDIIKKTPGLILAGTANDGQYALAKIPFLKPDVITMDVNMPKLDGIKTLQEIMHRFPTPVIMVSAVTKEAASETLLALESGAVDFITKPQSEEEMLDIERALIEKIENAVHAKLDTIKIIKKSESPLKFDSARLMETPGQNVNMSKPFATKIIAIGISTGGPKALKDVFDGVILDERLSILIVQHMPETFTGAFAARLNQLSNLTIKEAEDNDPILEGHVYIAPGHSHITVKRKGNNPYISLDKRGKVSGHMPSADVLFISCAKEFGSKTIGIIMTGMGRDGSEGMTVIKNNGGVTISQDEKSSVVFGMNREAILLGCVDKIVPLHRISDTFTDLYSKI